MKLNFKYSIVEELKEALNMLIHRGEYDHLRDVIKPSIGSITNSAINRGFYLKDAERTWANCSDETIKAFTRFSLRDPGDVVCYVHGISCEGWFDVDRNAIHVRVANVKNSNELKDTILHELLHLATYDDKFNYDKRESIVDSYIDKIHSDGK